MDRIDQISEMLSKDPKDSFLRYALALEYEKVGDSKKAIQLIKELIESDEEYLGAYYKLGQLYEEKNDLKTAVSIYKKGIELAEKQNDVKARGELNEALWLIEEYE